MDENGRCCIKKVKNGLKIKESLIFKNFMTIEKTINKKKVWS
jgi:hypothetical protein